MVLDIAVVILYLIITLIIGILASRRVSTQEDYSTGGRQYTSFVILATLFASFIGGGFTIGLAEKTFTYGLVFVLCMWGFSLKEFLIARYVAPRMGAFQGKAETIGDIMEYGFGKTAKIITGVASVLVCGGIIGAQVSACGNILQLFLGIPYHTGSAVTAIIVLIYATMGGIKSVIAADILHFIMTIIVLPLIAVFGIYEVGGIEQLVVSVPTTHLEAFGDIGFISFVIIFLSFFFGETLIPPYVQRLLIGKTINDTYKGTLYSAILSLGFFFIIGLIGLVAFVLDPHIQPHLALPYVIKEVMPAGLKGLAVAAMLAVVMSAADSFLNATSIAMKKDVLEPLGLRMKGGNRDLLMSKIVTFVVGLIAIIFSLTSKSAVDILLYSYQFWTPFILVPLVAVIYGARAKPQVFIYSALCGILALLTWNVFTPFSIGIDGALEGVLFGIFINTLAFGFFYSMYKLRMNGERSLNKSMVEVS